MFSRDGARSRESGNLSPVCAGDAVVDNTDLDVTLTKPCDCDLQEDVDTLQTQMRLEARSTRTGV